MANELPGNSDAASNSPSRVATLESRIDALAAIAGKPEKPWYKSPPIVISFAAFLISVVTTITSGYRTYRQDIENQKAQLRAILLQFASGYSQAAELGVKY